MNWISMIQETLNYIESHIEEDLNSKLLADRCYVSCFEFQRMFSLLCDQTLGEYIRKRRLTLAGYEVLNCDTSILEIALRYGYETNESFTRAFVRFHGITSMEAKKGNACLNTFSKISLQTKLAGGKVMVEELSQRGYVVNEAGAVYSTMDMDRSIEWFQNVLGWYGQIDMRAEDGTGCYGCVSHVPQEINALNLAPFMGFHMFKGEPQKALVAFMRVQGIEQLYEYVRKNGWNKITDLKEEPWGAKSCEVTTIDGCVIKFFELKE